MKRILSTSCIYRGAPIQIQGDRDAWSATVWLPDGGTIRSAGHQRYADAMSAARRIADEALLERAYRAAQGLSRWERRQRRTLIRDRWTALAVAIASIAYAAWWLSEIAR